MPYLQPVINHQSAVIAPTPIRLRMSQTSIRKYSFSVLTDGGDSPLHIEKTDMTHIVVIFNIDGRRIQCSFLTLYRLKKISYQTLSRKRVITVMDNIFDDIYEDIYVVDYLNSLNISELDTLYLNLYSFFRENEVIECYIPYPYKIYSHKHKPVIQHIISGEIYNLSHFNKPISCLFPIFEYKKHNWLKLGPILNVCFEYTSFRHLVNYRFSINQNIRKTHLQAIFDMDELFKSNYHIDIKDDEIIMEIFDFDSNIMFFNYKDDTQEILSLPDINVR